ncbi:MAG TPA: hypothetical protein VFA59_18780 [Vicinamibacterales bacterium]|nr:hypothetical protein [Vicinamibacterales bacterium]
MRATGGLIAHSLRRFAPMILGVGVLLGAFEFLLTQVAAFLLRHSYFSQLATLMPDFMRALMGPAQLAFMSFGGIVAFGYFHPMVIVAVVTVTVSIATETAAEVEMRFVDLTLARELRRRDVILRTLTVFVVAMTTVLGLMLVGTATGLACCVPADTPHISWRVLLSLALSLATLMVCWCGVALAAATMVRRRAVASGAVGIAALAAYLLDYLGRVWDPARTISRVSPFHYFDPAPLITGTPLDTWDAAVLVTIGAVGAIVGAVVFARRDI